MEVLTEISTAMDQLTNPVSKDLFLINSSIQAPAIVIAYLLFSIWIGPALMCNRKPFELTTVIRAYNLLQVVLSFTFAVAATNLIAALPTGVLCDISESTSEDVYRQAIRLHWFYFLLKILDLADTVFFVLRKKNSHLNFLHLYHHAAMVAITWIGTKFIPAPQYALLGILNSVVHTLMYFYYFLATFGPKYSKQLEYWKINLTRLQIVQFVILAFQGILILHSDCSPNKISGILLTVQNSVFLHLFTKFYIRTYMVERPVREKKNE